MMKSQEYDINQAQADLELVALPWARDHSGPGSRIQVMPPDLENKPWQSVEEFVSLAQPLPEHVPEKLILLYLRYKLVTALGGSALKFADWQTANRLVHDFRDTPAFADQPNSPGIAQQIITDIEDGKNIVFACAHQALEDLGMAAGATVAATGQTKYITDANFIPLSPTMKFEGIDGKDLNNLIKPVAARVWVWPQTPSASARQLPRRLLLRSNRGSGEIIGPILEDPDRGTLIYTALTGSRMLASVGEQNQELTGLEFPEVYPQAASALRLTDRALPFAYYVDPVSGKPVWEVGHFIDRDSIQASSQTVIDQLFMDEIMFDLSKRMERLAKVPVRYSRLVAEKSDSVLPPAEE